MPICQPVWLESFRRANRDGQGYSHRSRNLKEKCPYWYEAMQVVALNEGWDKPQARKLFDQAAAFEPTYYHFYREYANYLLPKWYGEEGETRLFFAEEVSSRLTPPDASVVFEIASLLACQCDKERDSLAGMSWPRVKQGFRASPSPTALPI